MRILPILKSTILLLFILSCTKNIPTEITTIKPQLLFKSGFEGDVKIITNPDVNSIDYDLITGTDSETNFTWPISILGANGSGLHYVEDDNRNAVTSEIQTVIGHKGNETKALYNKENYDIGVTQCPYEILDIVDGKKDLYVKYWIKMDAESLHQINKWRTFFEYKTKDYANGTGFRLIAFIYTDLQGNAYWHWQGDKNSENAIWELDNYDIPVPQNEWFLTEFYWHWSNGNDGRALWKINGEIVGDHHGPTTRNSKPIDFIMLTQIYGDANPKYQWIDDIEIWNTLPE